MTWTIQKVDEFAPEDVVQTVNHHRLMPAITEEATAACLALNSSDVYVVSNGGDGDVAKVFVHIAPGGGIASIDMIPNPRYFKVVDDYRDDFREVMAPVLADVFANERLRRITAFVPYSRGRTKKALRTLGFSHEGRIRCGVQFRRKDDPEDLFVMGMTAQDYDKEYGDGY